MFLIKNIFLYDPASGSAQKTDLLIENGKFLRIGEDLSIDPAADASSVRVLDGQGLCAAPGLIDTHAHFRDPGYTHKEDLHTGSLAAARGGYTSIILMANTNPVVDSTAVHENREIDSYRWFTPQEARENVRWPSLAGDFLDGYLTGDYHFTE